MWYAFPGWQTRDFAVHVRAALHGGFVFLEDEDRAAFAHDEAVAVAVEGREACSGSSFRRKSP